MKIAVTIDELLLWTGTPLARGYTPESITNGLLSALSDHGISGAYAFAHTEPVAADRRMYSVLEQWVDAGHHVGNHTHFHACLNWVTADQYCEDIRRAEDTIGDLIEQAPTKYFRYAMDMTGQSEEKHGRVEDYLSGQGYQNAPITAWFGDFAWVAPYARVIEAQDSEALSFLRESYVETAVSKFQEHVDGARAMFGQDVPYIWLIHGTPPAQDLLGTILQRFVELGAEFTTLETAMQHPANRLSSPVTSKFRNHLQRIGLPTGREFGEVDQELLGSVVTQALPAGEDPMAVYDMLTQKMCERAGGTYAWSWE